MIAMLGLLMGHILATGLQIFPTLPLLLAGAKLQVE